MEQGWDSDPLSWHADEYEALMDVERGVLLQHVVVEVSASFESPTGSVYTPQGARPGETTLLRL